MIDMFTIVWPKMIREKDTPYIKCLNKHYIKHVLIIKLVGRLGGINYMLKEPSHKNIAEN